MKKLGMYSSLLAFFSTSAYAVSFLLSLIFINTTIGNIGICFSSIFIAVSFIFMIYSYLSFAKEENKSFTSFSLIISIFFGIITLISCHTQFFEIFFYGPANVKNVLSNIYTFEIFFNYKMFGYILISFSFLFMGMSFEEKNRKEFLLKRLMYTHTIFGLGFFFSLANMLSDLIATYLISIGLMIIFVWCIYFSIICFLSFHYFRQKNS